MSGAMLSHIKVVDLADGLGAYTGMILAQLGAQVTKVEAPGGDVSRRHGLPAPDGCDASLTWLAWNTGKTGLTLDLNTSEGREQLQALTALADILIQSGGDRLARLGLDYETLASANPGLISVIVAPFAESGVVGADSPASDLTLMAMSGIMNMVGDTDGPPLKLPGEQAYALAGIQGAIASLTALNARAGAQGRGERVVVSAYQSAVLAGYRDPIVWEWTGRIGQRTGNKLVRGKSGVRQVWEAADGYVTWSLVDNLGMVTGMIAQMQADGAAGELAEVDWANTLLADAPQERIDHWESILDRWFKTKTRSELARASAQNGLGLSPIDTPADALASKHWAARGFWRPLKDEARGLDTPLPGPLYLTTAGQCDVRAPAPRLNKA